MGLCLGKLKRSNQNKNISITTKTNETNESLKEDSILKPSITPINDDKLTLSTFSPMMESMKCATEQDDTRDRSFSTVSSMTAGSPDSRHAPVDRTWDITNLESRPFHDVPEQKLSSIQRLFNSIDTPNHLTQKPTDMSVTNSSGYFSHRNLPINPMIPTAISGILSKQGKRLPTYSNRYFILKDGILSNYKNEKSSSNKTIIQKRSYKSIHLYNYTLISDIKNQLFIIESPEHNQFILHTKSKEVYNSWNKALKDHVAYANGYYHLVVKENIDIHSARSI